MWHSWGHSSREMVTVFLKQHKEYRMISRRSIMKKLVFLLAIRIALFPSFSKASLEVWRGCSS